MSCADIIVWSTQQLHHILLFIFIPLLPLCVASSYHASSLSEMQPYLHLNSAGVKRWWCENEVIWFLCSALNDGKLQCRGQQLEACCTSARGRVEQREGDGKGYLISWQWFSSFWLSMCSCTCTHTPHCLSDTLFSLPFHLLSVLQMQGMKRIGGVTFKCGNALAMSATSINTAACVQFTCSHAHSLGKHFWQNAALAEIVGWSKRWL